MSTASARCFAEPLAGGSAHSSVNKSSDFQTSASQFTPQIWSDRMVRSSPKFGTHVVPSPVTNRDVANEFGDLITDASVQDVADDANRTVEAAKKWRLKRQAPDSASLINSAQKRPKVRAWLMWRIGGDPVLARSQPVMTELHQLLLEVGAGSSAEAAEARRLFQEIFRGKPEVVAAE
jgi:hypothetical protein